MTYTALAQALGHTARKRRILDPLQSVRLGEVLTSRGLHDLDKVRRWLAEADGLSTTLAKELLKYLARPEQPPFGLYRPLAHLATGGMGNVWLTSGPDQQLMVVKSMRRDLSGAEELHARFAREQKFMQEINHPGVVRCLGGGEVDGTPYMVLEFVPWDDLKELAEGRGLPESLALTIIHHIAGALSEAHRRQLVHRDLKPANLFANTDGQAKLADFGIARSTAQTSTVLTMQGALVGSPAYMSPEQVVGASSIDIRSDLYALGAVLFFALTGRECYQGRFQEVLHAHRTAPVPDVRAVKPGVSPGTAAIISRCMAKKPEERFADPTALLAAVDAALAALGQKPGAVVADQHLAPRPPATPSPDAQATETMLGRMLTGGGYQKRDSYAELVKVPTPTGFKPITANDETVVAPGSHGTPAPGERLDGGLDGALVSPWVTLAGGTGGETERLLMLFAKPKLLLGKLREPPVDICLRNYPTTTFKDDCLKVSRQHFQLGYDVVRAAMLIEDIGSGNGTNLDGTALGAKTAKTLDHGRDHSVLVASAVALTMHLHARQGVRQLELLGTAPSNGSAICGLDTDHLFDAVTITRPKNRPELAYALVLRRLTLGANDAMLIPHGAKGDGACTIALFNGRWIWRAHEPGAPWKALTLGTTLTIGGLTYKARPGVYDDF
jgi:serine/threonine protein kinase